MLVGQHRDGNIDAHGGGLFVPVARHWKNSRLQIFICVTKRLVQLIPQFLRVCLHLVVGHLELRELHDVLIQPFAIGLLVCIRAFELFVRDDRAAHHVDHQHLARLQAGFLHNFFRRDIQHPHLGGEDHGVVLQYIVTGGTQAVAVQRCTHKVAVGEQNRSRAVPGLHHGGVIAVEVFLFPADVVIALPRFWDRNHHRLWQFHPAHHEEFDGVVQDCRVGTIVVHHREDLIHIRLKIG